MTVESLNTEYCMGFAMLLRARIWALRYLALGLLSSTVVKIPDA